MYNFWFILIVHWKHSILYIQYFYVLLLYILSVSFSMTTKMCNLRIIFKRINVIIWIYIKSNKMWNKKKSFMWSLLFALRFSRFLSRPLQFEKCPSAEPEPCVSVVACLRRRICSWGNRNIFEARERESDHWASTVWQQRARPHIYPSPNNT